MIVKLFSVYDAQMNAFSTPQFYHTAGVAERSFRKGVNSSEGGFEPPADFTLFELGEFDDETGLVSSHSAPVRVISALQVKETVS